MSAKHTPGKLTLNTTYAEPELRGEGGELISISMPHRVADASRLVACWNACDGISTEALEIGEIKDRIAAATNLLEAAIRVVSADDAQELTTQDIELLRAAIAKATVQKGSEA